MRHLYLLSLSLLFLATSLLHAQDDRWRQYLSSPVIDGPVHAIFADVDAIYVGGDFSTIEGVQANNIARFDRSTQTWSAFGPGTSGPVYAIARVGDSLYFGGDFLMVGPDSVNFIVACRLSDNTWHRLGSGINGFIYTMVPHGDDIYIGGAFELADQTPASNIVRWDAAGKKFDSLAAGLGRRGDGVRSIVIDGDSLYAAGRFRRLGGLGGDEMNNIARWDIGSGAWSALGSGIVLSESSVQSPVIHAMTLDGDNLYVGGRFDSAGGVSASNLARWTVSAGTWESVAPPPFDSTTYAVRALSVIGNDLYVGACDYPPGVIQKETPNLRRWGLTTSQWSNVGTGVDVDDSVLAMTIDGPRLLVGGRFTHAGNRAVNGIAAWDPGTTTWIALRSYTATSVNGPINAMASDAPNLYAGGIFTVAGEERSYNVARYRNGEGWSSMGGGVNGQVRAIASAGSRVYVGGTFTRAGDIDAANIAMWDTATGTWSALGAGTDGPVRSIIVAGNEVYVGGSFTEAGGGAAGGVARWDGATWKTLGTGDEEGVGGIVTCLASIGDEIFVGGNIFKGGTVDVYYIARWNKTTEAWSALAEGTGGPVYAMASAGSILYVGGAFQSAGVSTARGIARWNTATAAWDSCGLGVDGGAVYAIAARPGKVFVGGKFTATGGAQVHYIAQSGGGSVDEWQPLGSGVADAADSAVTALALDDNGASLYVGGRFLSAGGTRSVYFASWDAARLSAPNDPKAPLIILSNPTPNPAIDGFRFTVDLKRADHVRIALVGGDGHEACLLADDRLPAGAHELRGSTEGLPAGAYLLVVRIGDDVATAKVMVAE